MPRSRPTTSRTPGRPALPRVAGARRRPVRPEDSRPEESRPEEPRPEEPQPEEPQPEEPQPKEPQPEEPQPEEPQPEELRLEEPQPEEPRSEESGSEALRPEEARPEPAGRPVPDPVAQEPSGTAPGTAGTQRPSRLWLVAGALLLAAVLLGMLTLSWLGSYREARARADAWQQVLPAAKERVAELFSYDYRHVQADRDRVAGMLTGQFRTDYLASMDKLVVPQAATRKFVLVSTTQSAGVSSVAEDGGQAVVVVFLNQLVSNTAVSSRTDLVRLRVTMTRVAGDWLISDVKSV